MYYFSSNHRTWLPIKAISGLSVEQWAQKMRYIGIATCRPKNYNYNPFN